PDRSVVHAVAPITTRRLGPMVQQHPAVIRGDRPTIVIDEVDADLPEGVERMLLTALRDRPELRVIVAGRSTRGLEERAQRARVRTTIRFGRHLRATPTEL